MRHLPTSASCGALLLSAATGFADVPDSTAVLREVQVVSRKSSRQSDTAERPPAYDRLAVPATASGVQEITARQIEEMRPADVYDLFETALGISIRRQGSRVHNWVMDRGNSANGMGLVLDGVFISANESTRILGDLAVSSIESIRIVRDASLLTLGPILQGGSNGAANQGFILMTTKHAHGTGSEASLGYGTWNSFNGTVFHGERISDSLSFAFGYSRSSNDAKIDHWGNWYNGMDGNLFWGNAGWKSRWLLANATVVYNQVRRDIQRYQEANGTWGTAVWTYDPINTTHLGLDLSVPWNPANTTQITAGVSGDDGLAWYNTAKSSDFMVDSMARVPGQSFRDRTIQGNLLHSVAFLGHTAKVGGQLLQEMQRTEGSAASSLTDLLGFYASDSWDALPGLVLDAGARLDKLYVVRGTEKYTRDSVTTLTRSHMWTDDAWSAAAGALWSPTPISSLSGRVAFTSAPTPSTMITVRDLPAEKRLKFELGPSLRMAPGFGVSLTGFWYGIQDAKVAATSLSKGKPTTVTFKTKDGNTITVYDAHDLSRTGFEASVDGRILRWVGYGLGYSYQRSSYAPEDTTMMRYKVSGSVDFRKDGFGAALSGVYVPGYTHNDMPVGDFLLVNGSVSQDVRDWLTLTAWGRNLTDEKYTTDYKGAGSGYFYDIGAVYGVEAKVRF